MPAIGIHEKRLATSVADQLRAQIAGMTASQIAKHYKTIRAGDLASVVDGTYIDRGIGLKRLLAIGEAIGVRFRLRRTTE